MNDVCCPQHGRKLSLSKRTLSILGSNVVLVIGKCPDCYSLYVGKQLFLSCNRIQLDGVWYEYLSTLVPHQTELDTVITPKFVSKKKDKFNAVKPQEQAKVDSVTIQKPVQNKAEVNVSKPELKKKPVMEKVPINPVISPKKIVQIKDSTYLDYCPNDGQKLIFLTTINVQGLLVSSVNFCPSCKVAYIQKRFLKNRFELHTINSATMLFNAVSAKKCIFDGGELSLEKYPVPNSQKQSYFYPKKCKICSCYYFSKNFSQYFSSKKICEIKSQTNSSSLLFSSKQITATTSHSIMPSPAHSREITIVDYKDYGIQYHLCFDPSIRSTCLSDSNSLTPCRFMLMHNSDFCQINAKICSHCQRLFLEYPYTHYHLLASFSEANSSSYSIKLLTSVFLEKKSSTSSSILSSQKRQIRFDSPKHTLYICKGIIACTKKQHTVEPATGVLVGRNDRIILININHCRQCDQYFLGYTEYRHYRDLYGILLGNLTVTRSGSFSGRYSSMADESPLKLCGYNVSQSDDLTPEERKSILKYLIDHNIMTKPQIIDYLNFFINQSQNRSNMDEAVRRWKEDLSWVRTYHILKQNQFFISDIKRY